MPLTTTTDDDTNMLHIITAAVQFQQGLLTQGQQTKAQHSKLIVSRFSISRSNFINILSQPESSCNVGWSQRQFVTHSAESMIGMKWRQ